MIEKWTIYEPAEKPVGAVLALPGRGMEGQVMARFTKAAGLWRSLIVGLQTDDLCWYPQPCGPSDQRDAVAGQAVAMEWLLQALGRIERGWGIEQEKVALVGFSAGSVMSLYLAGHSVAEFAGVVSMGGAILEPATFPRARNQTPILLQHNMDDRCFKWDERYLPMRETLTAGGYNLTLVEGKRGGHDFGGKEAKMAGRFLAEKLGYASEEEERKAESAQVVEEGLDLDESDDCSEND